MALMSQEDILSSTRTVGQGLEALKQEHETIKATLLNTGDSLDPDDRAVIEEKSRIIDKNLESIRLGIEESQVMMALASHLQHQEAEKQKYKAHIRQLYQEIAWLRDEQGTTLQSLNKAEQRVAQLEEENKHLSFMNSLKKYDGPDDETVEIVEAKQNGMSVSLAELGFEPDDDMSNDLSIPTQSTTSESSNGYEIPHRLRTLHNLVIQYTSRGQYEVAVPILKDAIEDLEKSHGKEHLDVATLYNILALVYKDQHKYNDAVNLLQKALSIREKCYGENHPAIASTLQNIAILYGRRKQFAEAEPLCLRSLKISEAAHGPDHQDVAKMLNNLALMCQYQGKYDQVEQYYRRSVAIFTKLYGPDSSNVAKTNVYLGASYLKQGKFEEAKAVYKEVLDKAHVKYYGAITPTNRTIWQIAEAREAKKDYDGSVQEGHDWKEPLGSENGQSYQNMLRSLAAIYRRQGKYQAAESIEDALLRAKKAGLVQRDSKSPSK
uniref:Kinesin light chain n=1 Tax=Panagrellus redivivus TaxID=6233 RepID=A0A7E4W8D8_PANRE